MRIGKTKRDFQTQRFARWRAFQMNMIDEKREGVKDTVVEETKYNYVK